MHPTRLCFKLSILMGHLQLNYTMFDVWLTVLIFGSCELRLGPGLPSDRQVVVAVSRWSLSRLRALTQGTQPHELRRQNLTAGFWKCHFIRSPSSECQRHFFPVAKAPVRPTSCWVWIQAQIKSFFRVCQLRFVYSCTSVYSLPSLCRHICTS